MTIVYSRYGYSISLTVESSRYSYFLILPFMKGQEVEGGGGTGGSWGRGREGEGGGGERGREEGEGVRRGDINLQVALRHLDNQHSC